jgi:hypothetical protein
MGRTLHEVIPHPRSSRSSNWCNSRLETAIVNLALEEPDLSPRELAVSFTDTKGSFVSEAGQEREPLDRAGAPSFFMP